MRIAMNFLNVLLPACANLGISGLVALLYASPVLAQTAMDRNCDRRDDVTALIRTLQNQDEKSQLAAAATLGQIGRDALPGLLDAIPGALSRNETSDSWPAQQRRFATILMDVVRAIVSDDRSAIRRFRECDNEAIIKPLVWASRGTDTRLRISSANVLANVIDNTNICFVQHHLRDEKISISGRANLLGITNSMASYAYRDNKESIEKTLSILKNRITASGAQGLPQTVALMDDITSRLARSENKNVPIGQLGEYCNGYDFTGRLD